MSQAEISTSTTKQSQPLFSIIIPTWNNLSFLQLCIASLLKNSKYQHQIIIYVNDGSDGSLEWVKQQGFDYIHSPENIGICFALNQARSLVKTDYIAYLNDDMYICPDWDAVLWDAIQQSQTNYFFFSATMLEPNEKTNACIIPQAYYGDNPENFAEQKLLAEYQNYQMQDWSGATWPPNVVHKDLWDMVGGYSVEFSPGMYSDPDFSMKLWQAGVRHFQGFSASRVYHFGSKSTNRIKKNNGRKQFLKKWGITSSTFVKYYLKRGQVFTGKLQEPEPNLTFKMKMLINRIKRMF